MGILSELMGFLFNRFTIAVSMVGLGVAAGLLVFVYVFPGQPKIGVIDVPFVVITHNSTVVITEYLDYARRDDSIKAVVIKLDTPGGLAAASERLYREMAKLRAEKPVVLVMNELVASGGYMMAMGASHSYAQTSSLVGNVGVVSSSAPLVPPNQDESVIFTGPHKLRGFSRLEWLASMEDLKEIFAQIVVTERGDRLRITKDDLVNGDIYTGVRAVRLGLVDELGSDSDAFEKAAELAGITNYGLVDVNLEVLKQFARDFDDVFPSSPDDDDQPAAGALALVGRNYSGGDAGIQSLSAQPVFQPGSSRERMEALQGLALYGRLGVDADDYASEIPFELSHPEFYYLYLGNAE